MPAGDAWGFPAGWGAGGTGLGLASDISTRCAARDEWGAQEQRQARTERLQQYRLERPRATIEDRLRAGGYLR